MVFFSFCIWPIQAVTPMFFVVSKTAAVECLVSSCVFIPHSCRHRKEKKNLFHKCVLKDLKSATYEGFISCPLSTWQQRIHILVFSSLKCLGRMETDVFGAVVYVQPFRSDSDPLIIRGVESVVFLSEVLFYALLLKVMDLLQLILCDEKFCRIKSLRSDNTAVSR